VEVRFGRVEERVALEELQRRASLVYEETRAQLLAFPEAIELPEIQLVEHRVRVAEIAQEVVGFSVLLPKDTRALELDGLFVEPKCWRKGIGRTLINDAMSLARLEHAPAIDVIANPKAEAFYLNAGFVAYGTCETRFGPAILMRLELPNA
jgi:GNAT superfamily N-acetyltransferase